MTDSPKKILYYTQVFYLDAALEYIALASKSYEFHVLIELTPESLRANIFNLDIDLNAYNTLTAYDDVATQWGIQDLKSYFSDCQSVQFVIHNHKKSLSPNSFFRALSLIKHIKQLKPDFIHFEDISLRTLGLIPLLVFSKKTLILNVHDPKPHSGERDVKKELAKTFFFRLINTYVCFSEFSKNELKAILPVQKSIHVIHLLPYTYYQKYATTTISSHNDKITFVGRISKYKGIELLLGAIPKIAEKFPEQGFCIAGKIIAGYEPRFDRYMSYKLQTITKHLSNQMLVDIIKSSKVIVCPYLDATQSGVIMSAYALNKPVIVTPVGGLPEYVVHGKTGLILDRTDSDSLAQAIISFLDEEKKGNTMDKIDVDNLVKKNQDTLKNLYK